MMRISGDVSGLSSSESGPVAPGDSDATAELIAVAAALDDSPESVDRLRRALAAAELIVLVRVDNPDSPRPALVYVDRQGLRWIPVWSSATTLAQQWKDAGRGEEEITYAVMLGADLIRHGLPQLPPHTGVVLDPGTPHGRALPPQVWTATDDTDQREEDG